MSIELKKEPRPETTQTGRTIDLTPSWESLAFHIATLAVEGTTFESRKIGREELTRMAKLADKWVEHQKAENAKERLEYLREQIIQEDMSYGELAELQSLKEYIDKDDVQLREAAGIPENE